MMSEADLCAYCMAFKGVEETFPFGPDARVYKVMGKMFALVPVKKTGETPSISLKCDPELADVLRQTYAAVEPGYHLNKRHWNTITVDGAIPDDEVHEMIDNSYALVVKGLKKADWDTLEAL